MGRTLRVNQILSRILGVNRIPRILRIAGILRILLMLFITKENRPAALLGESAKTRRPCGTVASYGRVPVGSRRPAT